MTSPMSWPIQPACTAARESAALALAKRAERGEAGGVAMALDHRREGRADARVGPVGDGSGSERRRRANLGWIALRHLRGGVLGGRSRSETEHHGSLWGSRCLCVASPTAPMKRADPRGPPSNTACR